jgi:hypothetical protein
MCALPAESVSEAVRWAVSIAVPALAGLGGVIIGAWLTSGREKRQRQSAYLANQAEHFYSPMLGIRNEINGRSSLRVRVQQHANAAWQQLCAETEHLPVEQRQKLTEERWPEFGRIIEYDNERLHKDLLPAYRKMLDLFRENYWLADPATREFYPEIVEFVDIWERWVDKSLPVEVLRRVNHSEEKLVPFYNHVAETHDAIQRKLKSGASEV